MQVDSPTQTAARLRQAWTEAFAARDVEALASLYAGKAQFFGSTEVLHLGKAGVREYFATLRNDIELAAFEPPQVTALSPDLIVCAGYWSFRFGGDLRAYRLTWTLVREGERWAIAAHHASPRE